MGIFEYKIQVSDPWVLAVLEEKKQKILRNDKLAKRIRNLDEKFKILNPVKTKGDGK